MEKTYLVKDENTNAYLESFSLEFLPETTCSQAKAYRFFKCMAAFKFADFLNAAESRKPGNAWYVCSLTEEKEKFPKRKEKNYKED